jgi:hypothetical protein
VFPELPSSFSEFKPTAVASNFGVENDADSRFSSYDDYLTKVDQYYDGTWDWIGTVFTDKWSEGMWSGAQTPAPALNKAVALSASQEQRNGSEMRPFRPGLRGKHQRSSDSR